MKSIKEKNSEKIEENKDLENIEGFEELDEDEKIKTNGGVYCVIGFGGM